MVYLADFNDSQRDLLVRYMWQTGLWLSDADDDGAREAQGIEQKRLFDSLHRLARRRDTLNFIREAALEATHALQNNPPKFDQVSFLEDLGAFLRAMRGTWSRYAFRHYAQALVYLARQVAMADREDIRDDMGIDIPPETALEKLLAPFKAFFADKKQEALMNISATEDQAIQDLIATIRSATKE